MRQQERCRAKGERVGNNPSQGKRHPPGKTVCLFGDTEHGTEIVEMHNTESLVNPRGLHVQRLNRFKMWMQYEPQPLSIRYGQNSS